MAFESLVHCSKRSDSTRGVLRCHTGCLPSTGWENLMGDLDVQELPLMTEVMQDKVVGTTQVVNPHLEQREYGGVPRG